MRTGDDPCCDIWAVLVGALPPYTDPYISDKLY